MLVKEDCIWIDYLDIDEDTLERTLRDDAPSEVKQAYEKYLKEMQNYIDRGELVPK